MGRPQWEPLSVDDERGFTAPVHDFVAPMTGCVEQVTEDGAGRARLAGGEPPRVRMIITNAIDAYNQETIRGETLGSSDGSPMQQVRFLRSPLLEDEILEVRERQQPRAEDIADLGAEAVRPVDPDNPQNNEVWVAGARHSLSRRARAAGTTRSTTSRRLGPAMAGAAWCRRRRNNIIATRTGSARQLGNVNANTLTSLGRALAYIETVTNPLPANGGADRETIDEAKSRAPYTIKSRDRAVTSEDYEMLALRASTQLARARCVPDRSNRGHVTLALVPKGELRTEELTRRLVPSNEVLRYVKRYLDDRKLVGTVLNVVRPRYKDVSLKVVLIRRSVGTSDRLRRDIELKLRRYLHALTGGRDGKGWEFGRPVLKAELIHLIEEVPGVEGVDALEIRDELRNVGVEHLRLDDDELPFLVHVHIAEKVRDDIK
jgi:predicted phage baseplate assembly protein